jgi:hypothetical protein
VAAAGRRAARTRRAVAADRVSIEFHGEEQPLVFRGETAVTIQQVCGLIMPLRIPQKE